MKALALAACLWASTAFAEEIIITGNFPQSSPQHPGSSSNGIKLTQVATYKQSML
jgi:hypothetical protein